MSEKEFTELENYVADKIERIIEDQGISRYKFSQMTNITQASVSTILTRKSAPSLETMDKLFRGLGISPLEFFSDFGKDQQIITPIVEDKKILNKWHKLTTNQKNLLLAFASGLTAESEVNFKEE